jgi:arylsulfatase A-like enzyme
VIAALSVAGAISLFAGSASAVTPPNVVFIVTDDQRADTLDVMPKTRQLFEAEGTHFPNAFDTTPLCCPSRASILTGRYEHNHGVLDSPFVPLFDHGSTIERRLQQAGYSTGIFGKFLNGWKLTNDPPYFDKWAVFNNGPYTDFQANVQGTTKTISEYATGFVARKAEEFIQGAEQNDARPWFLYVAPTAPHRPFTPEAKYLNANVPPFVENPAFFEADRSDKPPYVQQTANDPNAILDERTAQLRMLMSVDDLVSGVFSALDATGETQNTLAFFISDNGFLWGEHGLEGKPYPYTYDVKAPIYMRWPGHVSPGVDDGRIAANIDFSPTVLDAAGIPPEPAMDGMSLLAGGSRGRIHLERLFASEAGSIHVPTWGSVAIWASTRTPSYQYTEQYGEGSIRYIEDSTASATPLFTGTDPVSPANDNSPLVKGTAAAGSTVRLYKAATTADCTAANLAATGTAAAFASPGLAVSVPDDSSTRFRATATDLAGNRSGCSTGSKIYVEDSEAPVAPTLTGTDPVSPANDNSPLVKGTAATGSTVRLYKAATTADCTAANLAATGTAAAFASPGLAVSVPDNSSTRFRATATDLAGNKSGCSTSSIVYIEDSTLVALASSSNKLFGLASLPAEPTLTDTGPDSPANANFPRVKGTADAGTTVRL